MVREGNLTYNEAVRRDTAVLGQIIYNSACIGAAFGVPFAPFLCCRSHGCAVCSESLRSTLRWWTVVKRCAPRNRVAVIRRCDPIS